MVVAHPAASVVAQASPAPWVAAAVAYPCLVGRPLVSVPFDGRSRVERVELPAGKFPLVSMRVVKVVCFTGECLLSHVFLYVRDGTQL